MSTLASFSSSIFFDIIVIFIIATIFVYLFRILKQPIIPAYVLAGILLGPIGLGIIKNSDTISTLSEIGIAFLLFIVGLELNLRKLKEISFVSSFVGILQVAGTFFLGYYGSLYFGFSNIEAVYIGFILAFSSTMIVVKLLSDKNELDTLHGRIIFGVLLVQDILVILLLSLLNTFNKFSFLTIGVSLVKGLGLFLVAILLSLYFLPSIFKNAAKSQELLFLCAVSVCFLFSLLAVSIGFSIAVGAFLAGLSLASLPYNLDIIGKVSPLKDFFALLFFVSLGMQLYFDGTSLVLLPLLYFLLLVILIKPFIVFILTKLFGYENRTSFLTAVSLGQISEFSLILVSLGLLLGHISKDLFSFTVLLAVISITITSYFIKYDHKLYTKFMNILIPFEKIAITEQKLEYLEKNVKNDIILFGGHRTGSMFIKDFIKNKKKFLVIDYNPEVLKKLIRRKTPCIYGDIINYEILKKANIKNAKVVISTIPNEEDSLFLIEHVKRENKKALIFVTAHDIEQALELYKSGADYVILPKILTGNKVSEILNKVKNKKDLFRIRRDHIKSLLSVDIF
ncbi:MAG: cation:proton antiporter [Candidatus Woesearchaeota archaeon]|nr:cation:proton antiporter [Candidatus Woesearchaeota archaeon]